MFDVASAISGGFGGGSLQFNKRSKGIAAWEGWTSGASQYTRQAGVMPCTGSVQVNLMEKALLSVLRYFPQTIRRGAVISEGFGRSYIRSHLLEQLSFSKWLHKRSKGSNLIP